jgi:hypothetical protein
VESGKFVFNRELKSYAAALYYLSAANFEGAVVGLRKLQRMVLPHCEDEIKNEVDAKINKLLDALGIMDKEVDNENQVTNVEHSNQKLLQTDGTPAVC